MSLDSGQLTTLRNNINSIPELSGQPNNDDGAFYIAAYYNIKATPSYYVWRSRVPQDEIMLNGFDWTRVDNLSVGKSRIWEWMFDNEQRIIDASKSNIRAGINACWTGTQADQDVRTAVYLHCQRTATRAEKLFAAGSGTSVSGGIGPSTMGFEGDINYQDVNLARNV